MCQPDLTFASCFANGRKCHYNQTFSLSSGVGRWLWDHPPGDQCPTLGPEGWLRPGFGQTFVASAQKVMFHGGILREFGVVARYLGILLLSVPHVGIQVANASTDAFLCTWIGRRHDALHCAMVFK